MIKAWIRNVQRVAGGAYVDIGIYDSVTAETLNSKHCISLGNSELTGKTEEELHEHICDRIEQVLTRVVSERAEPAVTYTCIEALIGCTVDEGGALMAAPNDVPETLTNPQPPPS